MPLIAKPGSADQTLASSHRPIPPYSTRTFSGGLVLDPAVGEVRFHFVRAARRARPSSFPGRATDSRRPSVHNRPPRSSRRGHIAASWQDAGPEYVTKVATPALRKLGSAILSNLGQISVGVRPPDLHSGGGGSASHAAPIGADKRAALRGGGQQTGSTRRACAP